MERVKRRSFHSPSFSFLTQRRLTTRRKRYKIIHARNLPNRINIFISENLFLGRETNEEARAWKFVYNNVLQFEPTSKSYVFHVEHVMQLKIKYR